MLKLHVYWRVEWKFWAILSIFLALINTQFLCLNCLISGRNWPLLTPENTIYEWNFLPMMKSFFDKVQKSQERNWKKYHYNILACWQTDQISDWHVKLRSLNPVEQQVKGEDEEILPQLTLQMENRVAQTNR